MRLLAISGSARRDSTNTHMLCTFNAAAPSGVRIDVFGGAGALPVFSPDLEGAKLPESFQSFIAEINASDGLIISSPEYVRAIPGGLKNAIDWLVSSECIVHKPVALAHTSHRGDDMLASLRIVLETVSSRFAEQIFVRFPLMSKTPGEIAAFMGQQESRSQTAGFPEAFAGFTQSCKTAL